MGLGSSVRRPGLGPAAPSLPARELARRAGWLPWADGEASSRSGADVRVGRRLALAPGCRLAAAQRDHRRRRCRHLCGVLLPRPAAGAEPMSPGRTALEALLERFA